MASRAEKEAMHRGLRPSEVIRDDEQEKEYDMPPKRKSFADKAEDAMEEEVQRRKAPKSKKTEPFMVKKGGKVKKYAEGGKAEFPDQSAEARKKRMEMPADAYGKMVDKTMGVSKGGKKGDFNEEPDTAKKVKKYAAGGKVSEYGGMEKYASKAAMKKHEKAESPMEEKLEKKMGRNMARASMQKVATKAVKKHEKAMHGMKCGGGVKKYAKGGKIDGCAVRGKTKGRMV